jgi:zinc transport system ATP-binding protein
MQSQQNNEIIRIDNVVVEYDHKVILPGVDLSIKKGDFIAITGPNGGGKTSLLRAILGLIEPRSGKVKFYEDGR